MLDSPGVAGDGVARSTKFFEERSDQSEVKARIIEKYFYVWANVVGPTARLRGDKIAYIDLYAGPGRYKDGAASTPLLILESATNDPNLRDLLVPLFNEGDKGRADTLQAEIAALPGIENLKHQPTVLCGPVNEDAEKFFNETRLVPSFSFIDPFGYKGLSLKIVNGVIKDWGCDCVFFSTTIASMLASPIPVLDIISTHSSVKRAQNASANSCQDCSLTNEKI